MERKIKLAGKEYEIKPNFKLSYALTKFRNKLSYGIDFDDADKEIIEEIARVQLSAANGQDVDMTTLSPKTLKYLNKKSNQKEEIFTYEELVEIGQILTKIESIEEIENIYDKEVEENGYDELVSKLTLAVSMVFMNVKDTSTAEE